MYVDNKKNRSLLDLNFWKVCKVIDQNWTEKASVATYKDFQPVLQGEQKGDYRVIAFKTTLTLQPHFKWKNYRQSFANVI